MYELLRIAVVTAGDVPGVDHLMADPNRGSLYELVAGEEADYVIRLGYPHELSTPNVISFHDGDLTRNYTGANPVADALLAGDQETRVSAILGGALALLSGPYPFSPLVDDARCWGDADLLLSYAPVHRTWMRRDAYGPMLTRLVQLLAAGTLQVVEGVVWIDGVPGPCRMGEAPRMCREREIVRGIPSTCPFISR